MAPQWPDTQPDRIREAYEAARVTYTAMGVSTDEAIRVATATPISLHVWQGDDVKGLEAGSGSGGAVSSGGLLATGAFPGRARNGDELRQDLGMVMALVPGTHRVNLHAFYAETEGRSVPRDELQPVHFKRWAEWAKKRNIGLDFNPTFFSHPKAASGYTLAHPDEKVRQFWVRHGIGARRIAEALGRQLQSPCLNNCWIPDGSKDSPADRWAPRQRLRKSLDEMYDESLGVDRQWCIDAVEGKLFGLGSEDYVVGSHEFYSGYAQAKKLVLTLDMGHFHPTESVADKLSALLMFHERILLHVSRPVRWDSDHVVLFNDDLRAVFQELVRGKAMDRVYVALDYFDPSINRLGAWCIGARATRRALLSALLEPTEWLKELETAGKGAQKLALMEELKNAPFGAVWDRLCSVSGAPAGMRWIREVENYESHMMAERH